VAICHDARKGRNTGSHWSKPVAPPLHSPIFISNRFRTKRSVHECDGGDGAGDVGMHELSCVGGDCLRLTHLEPAQSTLGRGTSPVISAGVQAKNAAAKP
jgi:hypothetical protein